MSEPVDVILPGSNGAATRIGVLQVQDVRRVAAASGALPVPNPYAKTNSQAPFLTHSSKGAPRINRKLEEIVLPEVHSVGVPLLEVVRRLSEDAKKFDPEKKGVNLLINNVVADYITLNPTGAKASAPPLLDPKGNPIATASTPTPMKRDWETVLIKMPGPLKDLTLRQVLDVICKTAEVKRSDGQPAGLKYSIEEYAIVFSARLPEQASLFSRIFRVEPETFIQGLASVVPDEEIPLFPGNFPNPRPPHR